jgi:hypothetical protein
MISFFISSTLARNSGSCWRTCGEIDHAFLRLAAGRDDPDRSAISIESRRKPSMIEVAMRSSGRPSS